MNDHRSVRPTGTDDVTCRPGAPAVLAGHHNRGILARAGNVQGAAGEVVPGHSEKDDHGHDQQHRGQMPQESHSGRRIHGRVSSLRPTPAIHLQRKAACTGTRASVTSAVRKWSWVQNGPVRG